MDVITIGENLFSSAGVHRRSYMISSAAKDPARAMQFMNWLYTSDEAMNLINFGIEGVDYVVSAGGTVDYPEGKDKDSVAYHQNTGYNFPNQFIGKVWTGSEIDIWEQYEKWNKDARRSEVFGFNFNQEPVSSEVSACAAIYEQYFHTLVSGSVDPTTGIKEFNDALYAAGVQKVIDEKQNQLNTWLVAK